MLLNRDMPGTGSQSGQPMSEHQPITAIPIRYARYKKHWQDNLLGNAGTVFSFLIRWIKAWSMVEPKNEKKAYNQMGCKYLQKRKKEKKEG